MTDIPLSAPLAAPFRPRDRSDVERTLRSRHTRPCQESAHWDHLSRDAAATRPQAQDELESRMQALELAFEVESAVQPTDTVEFLEDVVSPFVRARVPLRPRARATAWAHRSLVRLLGRFTEHGTVHARYDYDWRPADDEANAPSALIRLAVAAAWLAWSDLLVDPTTSRAHQNTLARLIDHIDEGLHLRGWTVERHDADAALAAIAMEHRLARHGQLSNRATH